MSDNGVGMWHDFATGEGGDIISFYRKAFPALDFPNAVDSLSWLMLGKSAFTEPSQRRVQSVPVRPVVSSSVPAGSSDHDGGALRVTGIYSPDDSRVPSDIRDYWRGRAISDEVVGRICRWITYDNLNVKGHPLHDRVTGAPVVDEEGNQVFASGASEALGMLNGLGGYALRSPAVRGRRCGFKGGTSSFITFIPAGGVPLSSSVNYFGPESPKVVHVSPVPAATAVSVDKGVSFVGFSPDDPQVMRSATHYLSRWFGRTLSARDIDGIRYVLSCMAYKSSSRIKVVEGMFDALSLCERDRIDSGVFPSSDIIVLNSVGNRLWASPILSVYPEVSVLLDNDLRSGAGKRVSDELKKLVAGHCVRSGIPVPLFFSGLSSFGALKDVNEVLMKDKGQRIPSKVNSNNSPKY